MGDMFRPDVRLGIVRSISYGLFGKPDTFVPQLRELGATLVRVYFYWSQVEPEPGRYAFEAVDAFLEQLDGSDLRLYGPADRVLADLETVRAMMRAFGYEKPLVVGEDNAPVAEPVPEATAAMEQAMAGLYERMADLPPQLQMFMRNLLALSAGVRWPSTGRGRQPGQSPSTHWARRNQPRCSMAA